MNHTAVVRCTYDSAAAASAVTRAIRQEQGQIGGSRAAVEVTQETTTVQIQIDAEDPRALRAGKNTWFSLLRVAEQMIGLTSSQTQPQ